MIKQECIGIPDMILLLMNFFVSKKKIKAEIVLSPGGAYFINHTPLIDVFRICSLWDRYWHCSLLFFVHLSLSTRPLCTMGTYELKYNLWFHYARSLIILKEWEKRKWKEDKQVVVRLIKYCNLIGCFYQFNDIFTWPLNWKSLKSILTALWVSSIRVRLYKSFSKSGLWAKSIQ